MIIHLPKRSVKGWILVYEGLPEKLLEYILSYCCKRLNISNYSVCKLDFKNKTPLECGFIICGNLNIALLFKNLLLNFKMDKCLLNVDWGFMQYFY